MSYRSPHSASVFQDRMYQAPITIAFDMSGAFTEDLLKKRFNAISLADIVVNYAHSMIDSSQ